MTGRPVVLLGLLACASDASPDRAVVVSGAPEEEPTAEWRPPDTGGGEVVVTQACGADGAEALDGDLALLSCARVSPEPDGDETVNGATDTAAIDSGELPPPPCGFFNLLGAVSLAGTASEAALLYCDADDDGGLRLARMDAASGAFETTLLAPGVCWADAQSGAQLETSSDTLLFWSYLPPEGYDGVSAVVYAAPASAAPPITDAAWVVSGTEDVFRVEAVPGRWPALVTQDTAYAVRMHLLDESAEQSTGVLEIAPVASGFGAGSSDGVAAVASCISDESVEVTAVDLAGGAALWTTTLTDAACGWGVRPAVAVSEGRVAVAWDDGELGWLALIDAAGAEIDRASLGKDSLAPTVAVWGDGLVTVDATGGVGQWSWAGELVGAWTHRLIAERLGSTEGLYLLPGDDALGFLLAGQDVVETGTGHLNTFYYLESSASQVPSP